MSKGEYAMKKKTTIKTLMLAVVVSLALSGSALSLDNGDIDPNWPPAGWQLLAEGYIVNFNNMGPFTTDSFSIRMDNGQTYYFSIDAPFATEEGVKRAFKMALMFYALNQEVAIFGTDEFNASSIRYRYNR